MYKSFNILWNWPYNKSYVQHHSLLIENGIYRNIVWMVYMINIAHTCMLYAYRTHSIVLNINTPVLYPNPDITPLLLHLLSATNRTQLTLSRRGGYPESLCTPMAGLPFTILSTFNWSHTGLMTKRNRKRLCKPYWHFIQRIKAVSQYPTVQDLNYYSWTNRRHAPRYSIFQEICTRFCCALLCCGYAIVHNEFTWSIYSYSSGLLCWHWGNR